MLLLCYKLKTSPIFILKETAWLLHARQGYLLQLYVQSICTLSSFLDRFNVSPSATIELLNRMAKVVWMLCVLAKYFNVISLNTYMHTCMKLHLLQPATMKVYIHTYIHTYFSIGIQGLLRNLDWGIYTKELHPRVRATRWDDGFRISASHIHRDAEKLCA